MKVSFSGNLKVCQFGHYDPDYSRNRVLRKALRRAGIQVVEVSDARGFLARTPKLLARAFREKFDVMLVGFPGHADVITAKLAALGKRFPVIFDAFVSLWDSAVVDRQSVGAHSFSGYRYRLEDRLSCLLPDLVLLDTAAQIAYFTEKFGVPESKFRRIWVGADDEVMYPRNGVRRSGGFTVFFYGTFIPLQGVEYIVRAAKRIEERDEEVRFVIVGTGPTYPLVRRLARGLGLTNVQFLGKRPYEELPVLMSQSDLCLGIFGTTPKTQRVIPNKVFDALACRRPLITADTPAVRECLTDRENVWLCPAGDVEALTEAIIGLKENEAERQRIAGAGYQLFKEQFSISAISENLACVIGDVLSDRQSGNGD